MDELKVFAEIVQRLHQLLQIVTVFSEDIRMEFEIDNVIDMVNPFASRSCSRYQLFPRQ